MKPSNRLPHARAILLALLSAGVLAACFPIAFEARMPLPEPLIPKMPFAVALHIPPEFASFTQKEKRWSIKWEVALGKAQAQGFSTLLNSMFERVIVVDSIEAAKRLPQPVRVILEPAIDEYAFVTPRDAGSSFFAVSIKYRMGIYTPEGRLADSWAFTGYGSATTAGMSDEDSLHRATTLALRDAAAKLAVEFRDQEIVRELLPPADRTGEAAGSASAPSDSGDAEAPAGETPAGEAPATSPVTSEASRSSPAISEESQSTVEPATGEPAAMPAPSTPEPPMQSMPGSPAGKATVDGESTADEEESTPEEEPATEGESAAEHEPAAENEVPTAPTS